MSYFNRYLLGGVVATPGTQCTTTSDVFVDGSALALYRLQGNGADDSGNGNNAVASTASDTLAFSLTQGKYKGSFSAFNTDGLNGGFTISPGSSFTVSGWIYLETLAATDFFFSFASGFGASSIRMGTISTAPGELYFNSCNNNPFTTTTTPLTANTWHHVVFTHNGSNSLQIYVDGVLAGSSTANTSSAALGATANFQIFEFSAARVRFADQVRVFNRTVNATEAVTLYTDYLCQPGSTAAFSQCTTDTVGYPIDAAGSSTVTSPGVVAYYKLDDYPGSTTVTDEVGILGEFTGQSGDFDGSSSEINLPNLGAAVSGGNTRTVSLWVNINDLPTPAEVLNTAFSFGDDVSNQSYIISITPTGQIRVSGFNNDWISTQTITTNTWFHIATVYRGGNFDLAANSDIYLNGVVTTKSRLGGDTGPLNTPDINYGIGYSSIFAPGGGQYYFDGSIDQIRVYDTALTAGQVTQLYNEPINNSTEATLNFPVGAGGTALYQLDGTANDTGGTYSGTWSGTEAYLGPAIRRSGGFPGTATNVTFGDQGIYGSAGLFNGTNSYVRASAPIIPASADFTYSCWVYKKSNTAASLLTQATPGTAGRMGFTYTATNDIRLGLTTTTVLVSTRTYDINQWHNIVLIRSGNTFSLYVNGNLDTSNTSTIAIQQRVTEFGGYTGGGGVAVSLDGLMDQVKFFDVALTAGQIKQLYEEQFCDTGCTTSTVDLGTTAAALYRLDGDANDSSTNAYTGTIGSNVTFVQGKYDLASNHTGAAGAANIIDTGFSPDPSGAITYSWWAKFNATGQNSFTIVDQTGPSPFPGLSLFWSGGFLTIAVDGSAAGPSLVFTQDTEWHHFFLIHDGAGTCTAYLDNTLILTDNRTPSNTTQNIIIGGNNAVWSNFNGQVDQLRVYTSALDATQRSAVYNEISCT